MNNNLSAKERLELFQKSLNQIVQENEVKNIRQLLHEKYLKKKAEEEKEEEERKRKLLTESIDAKPIDNNNKKAINNVKIGKQLAKVFRFENNHNHHHQARNRRQLQQGHRLNRNHQEDIDPLLNDPNVLFENFAFDPINDNVVDDDNNFQDENYHRNLPFFPEENPTSEDDQDIEDDSFKSLLSKWLKSWTWFQLIKLLLKILIYVMGQKFANSYGFGAPFLILAALIFICMNLRNKKSPHELSAYSVFNPNCRSIPTVSANEMPRDSILLGFGQGLGI